MYNVIINMVMLQVSRKFLISKRYQKEINIIDSKINIMKQSRGIHQVQELHEKKLLVSRYWYYL